MSFSRQSVTDVSVFLGIVIRLTLFFFTADVHLQCLYVCFVRPYLVLQPLVDLFRRVLEFSFFFGLDTLLVEITPG